MEREVPGQSRASHFFIKTIFLISNARDKRSGQIVLDRGSINSFPFFIKQIMKMEHEIVQQEKPLEYYPKSSFTVLSKGKVVSIGFDEITHISKHGCEMMINTITNRFKTHHSLLEILNDLPVNEFFQVHRSHIVSLQYIQRMNRNKIIVNNINLPITKYYKEQICKRLAMILDWNYLFILKNESQEIT
jgi:DNA-binding LytR/AlgR family response regulator